MLIGTCLRDLAVRFVGVPLLKLIWASCRFRIVGLSHLTQRKSRRTLLCLWHEHLLLMPHFVSRIAPQFAYCAVISHSRDGQLIRRAARGFDNVSFLTIPHDRKAHIIRSIVSAVDSGKLMVITPDGPRGPRLKIKSSLAACARIANAEILPLKWTARAVWRLPTWDQMAIPKPFSEILIVIKAPLEISGTSASKHLADAQRAMSS